MRVYVSCIELYAAEKEREKEKGEQSKHVFDLLLAITAASNFVNKATCFFTQRHLCMNLLGIYIQKYVKG